MKTELEVKFGTNSKKIINLIKNNKLTFSNRGTLNPVGSDG